MRQANLLRRALVALIVALPLIIGTSPAGAQAPRDGFPAMGAAVVGTVVSTNPTAGSFMANATVVGQGGTATQVTITTTPLTLMIVNGRPGTVANMAAGDQFMALFLGSPSESIQTLTASPALAVFDRTPPAPKQLYGFVGTVTGVDSTAGTVTVTLLDTIPSALATPGSSATFKVGEETVILGSSSLGGSHESGFEGLGGSLANVHVGDIVAGLVVGTQGESLSQVEAQPLNLMLDFPAPSSAAAAKTRAAALSALRSAMGGKSHHKHAKHHSHRKLHKHGKKA